ncbi:MAG: glutamine--fructose-6-phosphate transaminase (isomerizing) [Planctomycetaceae bacterium]|nr:glutamine--fructose-6-phosphate transaminase (isomerizing) [Planctomycetaceae bacterium]
MCGIVGYIGYRNAVPMILDGLTKLEYRGYDSAGLSIQTGTTLSLRKAKGRVDELRKLVRQDPICGQVGIGHTRWATHGPATDINAHPHLGGDREVSVVHNGVIENYQTLKSQLETLGFRFYSQTDTEVIAHLIAHHLREQQKLEAPWPHTRTAIQVLEQTLAKLKGTYGLGVLFRDLSDCLLVARAGSPLVIGLGDGENFIASDAAPLSGHTDQVVYLSDHELALMTPEGVEILHRDTGRQNLAIQTLDPVSAESDKGDYAHFMLKEIFEQPMTVENALRGRLDEDEATAVFGGLNIDPQPLRNIDRVVLTACGTSWHAGLVGEYLLEEFARIPTEVEYASELRYRNPPMDRNTMIFAITQSGETADTLAAMRETQRKGHPSLAICNVVGSTIAREADGGIYLHAGTEVGVASTKAFTSQVTVLTLLALYLGRMRHLSHPAGQKMIEGLQQMPERIAETLQCYEQVKQIAEKYYDRENFLYLGRLYNFPVALEGALKLKEISYIHAEGYPAAEMKHGPIALVEERTPSVFVIPRGGIYPKVISNLEEVKARKGPVIAVACRGDERVKQLADHVIEIPDVEEYLQPLVASIPLQLLAYQIAVLRGCEVDRPRNLAKSVTVE